MQNPVEGPTLLTSDAITEADTGATVVALELPAGAFIPAYGVTLIVAEDFAGGTPLLDVGDGDDPDGWVDQGENTATTAAPYTGTASDLAVSGKHYPTGGQIKVVVSASLTDGTAYVLARYFNLSNRSLAAV